MINWTPLTSTDQLDEITDLSAEVPCLILKHSTRCSISTVAKHRLEKDWDFENTELQPYYLDLISYREVSNEIVGKFGIDHQSPQVLLIKDGICVYDESHFGIKLSPIKAAL